MAWQGKILLIDDVLQNIEAIAPILQDEGFIVSFATSGQNALKEIPDIKPDLILLDINMPEMDGFEVCKQIKENTKTSNIPIIFLTADSNEDSIIKGFDVGAVDYIMKPINTRELISRSKTHINLRKAVSIAERANQEKSDFLSTMSHEIRTPMNAILGFTDLLVKKCKGQTLKQVEAIHSAGESLIQIINDILDISKIDAGKMKASIDTFYLFQLLDEIQSLFSGRIQEKGLNFNIECCPKVPKVIKSDKFRIKQILINLIGNAIKFTEKGSVTLKLSLSKVRSKQALTFSVVDTGRGIPEKEQNKIFEYFEQVEFQDTSKFGGTGLGLHISRSLAKLLNGAINVESTFGKGSSFSLTLYDVKIEQKPLQEIPIITEYLFKPAKVLIVDDNELNVNLFRDYLEELNLQVAIARNSNEAREKAEKSQPELIIMDIYLGSVSGIDLTNEIRTIPSVEKTPIIATTATLLNPNLKVLLDQSFEYCLTKPVSFDDFALCLSNFLECEVNVIEKNIEKQDIKLLKEIIELSPEIVPSLKKHQTLIKESCRSLTINDLSTLGKLLLSISESYPIFKDYAEEFNSHVENFNIDKAKDIINELSQVIY